MLVRPDSDALTDLVKSWEEINHLYVVENFLRNLLSKEETSKCDVTATLTNSGNFSVVLSALSPTDHTTCFLAGKKLADSINSKSPRTQDAMLSPVAKTAALLNPFNPGASIKGFLHTTQNQMISKANDLRDQATGKANDALLEVDRKVQERKQYNKASKQSSTLFVHIWTYACVIICTLAIIFM